MNQFKPTSTRACLLFVTIYLFVATTTWGQTTQITPIPVSGRGVSPEAIIPADSLARIQWFREELETIRFEMGKPKERTVSRLASDASSHEVYFQAVTLFIKADRLALELTGSTGIRPKSIAIHEIRPYHNWLLISAAYDRLMTVKQELGIPRNTSEKTRPDVTKPTEVGLAIVSANRQLNLMLDRHFSPSDVFQQVTWGLEYAKALLAMLPSTTPITASSPFVPGKQPGDVFLRLVECFARIEVIAKLSGMQVLHLDETAAKQRVKNLEITPSQVYDLATLLVSDLTYLYGTHKHAPKILSINYPGRKFPSHVYQQAGNLLTHLDALEQHTRDTLNRHQP